MNYLKKMTTPLAYVEVENKNLNWYMGSTV